ncbi:MAG: hypothetical protein SGJ02_04920, partial [bacterium]|nr:hypothetical protein [bacterium]
EEFEKLRIISVTVSDVDDDTYIHDEGPEYIKAFISTSIAQAVAEERERVVDKIRKAPMWKLVPNTPRMIMCSDKEFDNFLSSLDKPLTDKE